MEGLGFDFNVISKASGKHVDLSNARGVTFICYEDGGAQAITIKESIAGASEAAMSKVNFIHAADGVGGVWTRETSDADTDPLDDASALTKKDTTAFDALAVYIDASWLSDGFDSVECTVDAGECVAIVHGMKVKRAPQNLPASAV